MRRRIVALALVVMAVSAAPVLAATTDVVDGLGTGGGRIQARIATDTASIVRAGVPWVFYGANPEYGYRLRLAKLASTSTYRTLDGTGATNGRTTHSVGTDVSAVSHGDTVHVFYRDETADTLRHGRRSGGVWSFETLDGNSTVAGRTTHDVGLRSVAIVYRDRVHVFYADVTAGDIRRAVFDGSTWRFSVVDGNATVNGRTTAAVGGAIAAGVWDSRLHVLYTEEPSGLREATMDPSGAWTYSSISSLGDGSLALRKVSSAGVLVAYAAGGDIYAGRWNGATWSIDQPVSSVERVTGLTIFLDGATPFLAAGLSECFGSGGCDRLIGVAAWNGSTFDDPYFGGSFVVFGEPPGVPSSAVTIGGLPHLFVGGFGFRTEPDIYEQVLLEVSGPF